MCIRDRREHRGHPALAQPGRVLGRDDPADHHRYVVGGILPPEDAARLRERGVAAVFTPQDYKLTGMMDDIVTLILDAHRAG